MANLIGVGCWKNLPSLLDPPLFVYFLALTTPLSDFSFLYINIYYSMWAVQRRTRSHIWNIHPTVVAAESILQS